MLSFHAIAGLGLFSALIGAKGVLRGSPRRISLADRLASLPTEGAPVEAPVRIRWNQHQVPWIEARHDHDLAAALGVVHAHLRLTQIEIMRRIAYGRISEVVGPAAIELDRALRIMNVGRAVPDILAMMPETTRTWLDRFADGMNHVIGRGERLPPEFDLLGLRPEPWTAADLVSISRLAAADFSWRVWLRLLRLRGRPDWLKLWQRLTQENAPVPSFAGSGAPSLEMLDWAFGAFARHGSNALAVARERSATGGALLAGDPHLSLGLPNVWLIVGCRSPGYHMVGMMIPGIPALGLGRNADIGWGGTSLHAASSELFDVSELAPEEIRTRRETIRVRWWPDQELTLRDTEYGPVISDAPILPGARGRQLGMHWVGHLPTDDLTALLGVNKARGWEEFHAALDGFAIPALNMIYADAQGRVGQAMAAKLPRRPPGPPPDLLAVPAARRHWESFVTARDLPSSLAPPSGFVVSANNRPESETVVPVGFFFSPDDRVIRMRQLVGGNERVTIDTLKAAHRDVLVPSALALRDLLLHLAPQEAGASGGSPGRLLAAVRDWDGNYDARSPGALAFELVVYHFVHALHGDEDLEIYAATWDPWSLIREDLQTIDRERLVAAMQEAIRRAAEIHGRFRYWGDAHRLRLSHVLGSVPVLGRRYRFTDLPASGSNETLMKTAHGFSGTRHAARMGANARHISDFADPDANHFVLLGGQDGWLGSTTFLDQLPLWQRGDYIQVPLRSETVERLYPHETVLTP